MEFGENLHVRKPKPSSSSMQVRVGWGGKENTERAEQIDGSVLLRDIPVGKQEEVTRAPPPAIHGVLERAPDDLQTPGEKKFVRGEDRLLSSQRQSGRDESMPPLNQFG